MTNKYIQDKLDAIENDLKEKGYTKFERETIINITKQSLTNYHNHIVDVLVDKIEEFANSHSCHDMAMAVMDTIDFIRPLQDTNPKE